MPLIMLLYAFMKFVAYLWCSSCARDPRTSQVHVWMMHTFRGRSATTWPFETNPCVWVTWCSLKGALKGKGELGPCKDFHYTPVLVYSPPSSFLCSYCFFALNWHFGEAMGLKGPKMILFWCLMPKGEKLRPKQMDQRPLENFENSRVRIFWFVQNTLIAKFGLFWGRIYDYGEKGEFLALDQFFYWNISLCA
jgi:hypothetical protein